jgi:hypothetical protein
VDVLAVQFMLKQGVPIVVALRSELHDGVAARRVCAMLASAEAAAPETFERTIARRVAAVALLLEKSMRDLTSTSDSV